MEDIRFDINNAIDCNNWFVRSPQPIFVMKVDGSNLTFHRINRSACELLKCTDDGYHSLSPLEIGLFKSDADIQQYIDSEIGPEGVTYVTQIIPLIEPEISSEITLYKMRSADGQTYLTAFQQNAGNLTKILSALRHSEFRFLMMAENITDGIMIYENGKLTFANTASTKITGYSKEQLKTTSPLSLICDYERERVQRLMEEQKKTNPNFFSTEVWILNRTGQEKCIKCVFSMTKTQIGETISYNVITDITAQKLTERALIKSQEEFKMLADNSPDIITRYNRNLTYAYVNRAIEEITKIPAEKFIGRNTMDIELDQNMASFIEEMHLEVFRTGRKLKFEFRMNVDGKQRIFQASMVPEMSKDGSVNTVLNVSRDITQIKEFEVELNKEKQRMIESNSNIASNIKLLGVKLIETCPELKNTSLFTSITRIAEWTGIGARLQKLERTTVDVIQMLTDYHLKKTAELSELGISLILDFPDDTIKIYTDPHILNTIFNCLLDNAVESEGVTEIHIGFGTSDNNEVVFFMKDNGCGIKSDMQEKIFEPFCTIGKNDHSGLGLSTARKCVEHLKGRIWCYSEGKGAQFFFTHPIGIMQPNVKSDTKNSKWARKKIHVVEDTDANYVLIEAMLKLQGVIHLSRSVDGQQAVEYVRNNTDIDLILMDIQLPDMDGYAVAQQIRTFNTKVPIIAQTAYAMYADVVKAINAGCNDFIAKPIKVNKMLALLDKYLG
ncbi:MAG: PAS domain S-box protein [Salinivirgaceae bacterium]|nr:PAS domain S-box protein [Salinivirgaceae bacterium]